SVQTKALLDLAGRQLGELDGDRLRLDWRTTTKQGCKQWSKKAADAYFAHPAQYTSFSDWRGIARLCHLH
ncbi:MAG TPA: hypothetical protein VFJ52_06460, partial [Terriglobia bacterium]|nr:hypothetical protein [Terriglobia bacterium]